MELCGIVFALPAGICVGLVYCCLLDRVVSRWWKGLLRLIQVVSCVVLAGLLVELVLLATLGPVPTRAKLGPAYSVAHLAIFVLGAPALANVLVLRTKRGFFGRWPVAGAAFGILFTALVLLQYFVSESLYGIDGSQGPFS